jgi:hypothetical protein
MVSIGTTPKVFCHALLGLLLAVARVGQGAHSEGRTAQIATSVPGERARGAFDFVNSIGVNTHLNYFDRLYGNFPLVQRELESAGIRHLRDGLHFQDPGYNKLLYGRWAELARVGIRFNVVLDPRSKLGPDLAQAIENGEQMSGQAIESIEGANELDISGMPEWTAADRAFQGAIFAAARSVHAGSPIQVIGPSMAFAAHGAQLGDLSDYIDEGNLHPYPAGKIPSVVFPEQTDFAETVSGAKPVVFTESGYHNALNDHTDQPAVSELAASKYIPRLFLEDFAHGIARTYLYEFLDEAPDPQLKNNQFHWGLIRSDGTEKPAFTALKNLITELSDRSEPDHPDTLKWSISASDPQIHHLLLEKSNGEFDLVLWREVASFDPRGQVDLNNPPVATELTLDRTAAHFTVYEPATQSDPVAAFTSRASIPLKIPDQPLVISISLR